MVSTSRAAVMASVLALLASGCSTSAFTCEQDAACMGADGSGVCEPTGFCSFPDETCPSGRRYGNHAVGTFGGACLPTGPEESTGTTGALPTPTPGADSSTGGFTSGPAPAPSSTSGLDEDSGADDSADGSTTRNATTDGWTTGGSSTGSPDPDCTVDDFEDGRLDPRWEVWQLGDALQPLEEAGALVHRLPTTSDGWVGSSRPIGSLDGMSVTLEIEVFPDPSDAFAWFNVSDGLKYEFAIHNGTLEARTGQENRMQTQVYVPFDPEAHRFLRLAGGTDELVWSTSPDGESWTELYVHSATVSTDFEVDLGLGTWLPVAPGAEVRFAQVDYCPDEG